MAVLVNVDRLPAHETDPYDAPYANAAALHQAGVRFAIVSDDASHSRNLPYEAAMARAFGLPADAALRAITLSPAEIFGVADRTGLDHGRQGGQPVPGHRRHHGPPHAGHGRDRGRRAPVDRDPPHAPVPAVQGPAVAVRRIVSVLALAASSACGGGSTPTPLPTASTPPPTTLAAAPELPGRRHRRPGRGDGDAGGSP